jgi:phosphoglucosamine mutase
MTVNLFGTDGVRGIANTELTGERAFHLGEAAARRLAGGGSIVVGRDTRRSGDLLEHALIAGICAAGGDVLSVGVMPTPAVAFLVRDLGAGAGAVISASHNPAEYNGIKFFDADGFKLTIETEEAISADVAEAEAGKRWERPTGGGVGRAVAVTDADERYIDHCLETIPGDLEGIKVVLDCANGAAVVTSPAILRQLGADVTVMNAAPNGLNINLDCGSTHLEGLIAATEASGADVGLAHDGDADRVLAVGPGGAVIDGDRMMAICARNSKRAGRLPGDLIVVTVMTNRGFVDAMTNEGITVVRTAVGDREVLSEMRRRGAMLGGEQSGHVIFLEHNTTGDGIVTALQLLAAMRDAGTDLGELAGFVQDYPQASRTLRVADRDAFDASEAISGAIAGAESELGENGRVVVRPSGTEPVVRVMVEAKDETTAETIASGLAEVIEKELGRA